MITVLIPPQFIFIHTISNDLSLYTITSWYNNLMGPLILGLVSHIKMDVLIQHWCEPFQVLEICNIYPNSLY